MRNLLIGVLVLLLAGAAFIVLAPRFLDYHAKPVAGAIDGETLVLEGPALATPDPSPEQTYRFADNVLELTVLADQPAPTPAERGVRILLTPERVTHINDRAVVVEVQYRAPATGAASGLATSLQGIGPSEWIDQPISAGEGVARYELPAQSAVDGLGLRALSETPGQTGALTVTRIRISPAPEASPQPTSAAETGATPSGPPAATPAQP